MHSWEELVTAQAVFRKEHDIGWGKNIASVEIDPSGCGLVVWALNKEVFETLPNPFNGVKLICRIYDPDAIGLPAL